MLTPNPTESVRIGARPGQTSWWMYAFAVMVTAGHVPLLVAHAKFMWARPHYQYFPLLLAAVAYLVWRRWPTADAGAGRDGRRLGFGMLVASLLVLTFATAIFSPWLGCVAAVVATGGLLLCFAGRAGLRALFPAWLLMWLLVPMPFDLDVTLVSRLQSFTASTASRILDVMGLNHNLSGNILELPGRRLLVEEACSGIQSLFSLLACTAFFVVWACRPVARSLLLLASVVVWAILANVIRLLAVALAYQWFDSDLSSGWPHELLGIILFAFAFAMVLCTDQLLSFFFGPIDQLSPIAEEQSPLSRLWNRLLGDRDRSATASTGNAVADAGSSSKRRPGAFAFGCCLLILGFAGLGIGQVATVLMLGDVHVQGVRAAEAVDAQTLPDQVSGWTTGDFQVEHREANANWGEYSKSWNLKSSQGSAKLSCDYPFQGWHNLMSCYQGQGWKVVRSNPVMRSSAGSLDESRFMEVEMSRPNGQFAYLVFGLFDTSGQDLSPTMFDPATVPALNRFLYRAKGSIERSLVRGYLGVLTGKGAGQLTPTSYQLQLFVASNRPISKTQRDDARRTFLDARELFHQHWRRSDW